MLNRTYRTRRRLQASRTVTKKPEHLAVETLEQRLVLDSTVVFNEIMYNPPEEPDDGLEWIELHNQLAVNLEISDWVLEGGVDYTFPLGTIVPGHGYLVVASDPEAFQAATGIAAEGPFTGRLDNRGEELRLYNNDQRLMNLIRFKDGGDWPTAPDGSGATLAKADEQTASDVPANWTHSPEMGGTPGAANFIAPGSFIFEDVLAEGATARALIPFDLDSSLGTKWIDPAYDDSAWTVGTTAVGFDNGRRDTYTELLGFDLDAPPNGQSPIPMQNANASVYIRIPFQVDGDLSQVDKLLLKMRYDDGFVAYLNGTEIASANAPGRDGDNSPLSWLSSSTRSHSDRDAVRTEDFNIAEFHGAFVQGENILAIHALNRNAGDDDLIISPQIVAGNEVLPDSRIQVAINEVAAADADDFYVEISNDGNEPMDVGGFVLTASGAAGGQYVLPARTLPAGGLLAINQQELGFRPDDGERVFLYSAGQTDVVDGRPVTGRLRGRSDRYDDRWLYPDTATPGAANSFQFQDDVVINEIMYHAFPEQLPKFKTQPTFQRTTLVAMDASDWRFRESAEPLPADWATMSHALDGSEWREGQGPLGFSARNFTDQINTQLSLPVLNNPLYISYYFENDFEFTGSDKPFGFELKRFIHGGAVFYVNGVEVERFNMPEGEIRADTPASSTLRRRNVEISDRIEIPSDLLVEGTNRLSVEVHRPDLSAIEVLFGAQIRLREEVVAEIPSVPFIESDEEWIELYNRGTSPVDLSGWMLSDAVRYEFAEGTMLGAGDYLVVANDAQALAAKYPTINIVGDFSGTLSNHDDWIRLLDPNDNPADEVHYYEGGRWPVAADSGGSSLELRNPHADNSNAAAWAASDETQKSEWHTITYRELSQTDILGRRAQFNEFIFGLLDSGEFLIDDIRVVQDPDGEAIQLLQNGTFQDDTIGEEAEKWRIIGTHQGTVVADPDDPNKKVLHVVASGPHQFAHDYASTTFVDDTDIQDDVDYEFSFRAKWLSGSAQLNTRLFFTRASHTSRFVVPDNNGTPGAANSAFQANIGPTYTGFGHKPITPLDSQEVTVSVQASDPDGVASTTLWWKVGADWNSLPMAAGDNGVYTASIPPQASGEMVQFYVEGTDTPGATSTFPAAGPDSRALYQVEDGQEARKPTDAIDTLQLIFLPEEESIMFPGTRVSNQMGNQYVPFTLVHNNTAFYDVGIRQVGSRFVRPNSGYKIQLHPDKAFYGVHDSVRIDLDRQFELVIKQMINQASGTKSSAYDDMMYLVSPRSGHTHVVLFQLARFEAIYLDEQFENGSSGTKFELDDVVFPTSPRGGVEGPKTGTGTDENNDIGVNTAFVVAQGDNPETYRGHVLIKNQRAKDDYESIVRLAQAIHLQDEAELYAATQEVMDVDLWMRQYAIRAFVGDWDTYGFRRPKNLRMYVRPEDGKVIPLFWDADQANFTETIYNVREASSRLDEIRDIPANLRVFWGHMLDLINRSFNPDYATSWVDHYGELAGGSVNNGIGWNQMVDRVTNRTEAVLIDMETGRGGIARVPFEITTSGGQDFPTDSSTVTLAGTGWVDIRRIHLQGNDQPLNVTWIDVDKWEIELPVVLGQNEITLETFDYEGNSLTTDSIVVTSSASNPVMDSLRITEINYNPFDPTPDELAVNPDLNNDDFEFIELQNVGTDSINLLNVRFSDGIDFQFPAVLLAAGESGVVVKDLEAFSLRYGTNVNVLGEFENGQLNNMGESLTLVDPVNQTIVAIEYGDSDPWPESADRMGATLQLVDVANTAADRFGKYYSWQGSMQRGGSPGSESTADIGVVINEVLTNTDQPDTQSDAIELYNTTDQPIDISGWYLSDSSKNPLKFQIPAGTTIAPFGYQVFDEQNFNPNPTDRADNHFALSGANGDDVWLVIADEAGGVQSIVDDVHFGAARSGQSFGRVPNGSGRLAPMSVLTLGGANASPAVGALVISEIHYMPEAQPEMSVVTADDLEFVELVNTSSESIELADWRLRGGIDFDFDTGTLGPGEIALLLSFNPDSSANETRLDAFRAHYGITDGVHMFGGYQGQLSDKGEAIRVRSPDSPADDPSSIAYVMEDEVLYDNLSPWPSEAAGSGRSLTRTSLSAWGNDPAIWTAATPTPGAADVAPQPGDSNGDGVFNQLDIAAVLQAGKYLTGEPATFEQGDWNGDGVFNQLDIVAAQQTGNYRPDSNNAVTSGVKSEHERYLDEVDLLFAKLVF